MSSRESPTPANLRLAQTTDILVYSLLTVGLLVAGFWLVSIPLGAGLVGVKYGLFIAGFGQLALAVIRLWPSDPDDLDVAGGLTPEDESRFQRTVQRVIPVETLRLRPRHRIPTPIRMGLAGLGTLLVSLSLEFLFGVPG